MGDPSSPTKRLSTLWWTSSLTATFETQSRLSQVVLVAKLAMRLSVMSIRGSPMWFFNVLRLVGFAAALMPALLQCAWYWFWEVRINVPYGPGLRHLCDIYPIKPPPNPKGKKGGEQALAPVVIFVAGGAWVIGYKAWGVPLGRALSLHGVLMVAPDYRNCPQCNVDGMVDDVDRAVAWCVENVERFGGDPDRIVLVGQSAGAHLCALLLARKLARATATRNSPAKTVPAKGPASEFSEDEDDFSDDDGDPATRRPFAPRGAWRPGDLRGFCGVSGPYHVHATAQHWKAKGFGQVILDFIFGDEVGMTEHSPTTTCAQVLDRSGPLKDGDLCRVALIHGTADMSAPPVAAELLEARLRLLGARVEETRLYRGWTHTDPILERPFMGDQRLHKDIYDLVNAWTPSSPNLPAFDATQEGLGRLCPQPLIDFGHACMPF